MIASETYGLRTPREERFIALILPWLAHWICVVTYFDRGATVFAGIRFSSCAGYPVSVVSKFGVSWTAGVGF